MLPLIMKSRLFGFALVVAFAIWSGATNGIIPTLIKLSPLAEQLLKLLPDTPEAKQDSLRLGEYLKAIADLIREDRQNPNKRLVQTADTKDFMKRVGDIAIGSEWKLPQKYPDLTKRLVEEFESSTEATIPDTAERLGKALSEIGGVYDK